MAASCLAGKQPFACIEPWLPGYRCCLLPIPRQGPLTLPFPPQYDKFHLRGCIDSLLMELWRDPACAASLTAAAQRGGGAFAAFVGAVLNDLMYLLKDSLQVGRQEIAQPPVRLSWSSRVATGHTRRAAGGARCPCGNVPAGRHAFRGRCRPWRATGLPHDCGQAVRLGTVILDARASRPPREPTPARLPACSAWRTSTPWRSAKRMRRAGSRCRSASGRRSR